MDNQLAVIPAANFCSLLAANVDYAALSDAEFRDLVRTTLSLVDYHRPEENETVAATLDGEYEVVERPDGLFDVLAAGVVRHPACNHRSAIGAVMHYLTSATYRLAKVKAAIS